MDRLLVGDVGYGRPKRPAALLAVKVASRFRADDNFSSTTLDTMNDRFGLSNYDRDAVPFQTNAQIKSFSRVGATAPLTS